MVNKKFSKKHIKGRKTGGITIAERIANMQKKMGDDIQYDINRSRKKFHDDNRQGMKRGMAFSNAIKFMNPKNLVPKSAIKRFQTWNRKRQDEQDRRQKGGKKKKKSSGQYTKKEKKKINGVIKVIYTKKKSRKLYVKSKGKMINLVKYKKILSNKKK